MASQAPAFEETPEEIAYELRAAESALWIGSRFLIGIAAFIYASLAFAYFYLRSANNMGQWRPHHVTAPTALGAAIFAFTAATFLCAAYGQYRFRRNEPADWIVAGWTGVLLGALGLGLQIYELTRLPFYPGSSGYASVFIGWGAINIAALVLGVYWLETLLARAHRLQREVKADGGLARSTLPAARLLRANLEGSTYVWGFLTLASLFFWIFFYLV
jgi:heme/copper-type cytochrome/quinol oxidase subunit 3